MTAYLDILALKARGQRLGELLGLLRVGNLESVQIPGAPDLELGPRRPLADLDELGVPAAGLLEEVTDVNNLLRHDITQLMTNRFCRGKGQVERRVRDGCERNGFQSKRAIKRDWYHGFVP